jgi:hypothetical protein
MSKVEVSVEHRREQSRVRDIHRKQTVRMAALPTGAVLVTTDRNSPEVT